MPKQINIFSHLKLNKSSFVILGSVVTTTLTLNMIPSAAQAAVLGFQGYYAPSNWTLTTGLGNGFVDTSNVPNSITLTGADTGNIIEDVNTDYTIVVPNDGLISFNWSYSSEDDPGFDSFLIVNNGNTTLLTNTDGESGLENISVSAGDLFGFRINTTDSLFGPGIAKINNFSAPSSSSIPDHTSVLTLVGLGLFGLASKLGKKKLN